MNTFTNVSMPLRLFGVVLVLALVAVAALLVTPTSAQSPDNTYDAPKPCGPGAETAFQPEPHEITKGHYALFDAYWEWLQVDDPDDDTDSNVGVLHTNLCPPLVTQTTTTENRVTVTVTNYTASGIDIGEAIFHILDKHKATVVSGEADNSVGAQISMDDYDELRDYVVAGASVWWLRLDDDGLSDTETENLSLGFSTGRFDDQYWAVSGEDPPPPFRYMLELKDNPGIPPEEHPHFLAYKVGTDRPELVWDSAAVHTEPLEMEPGQFEHLEWVFTKAGTYAIWVHLRGNVRKADNPPADAGDNWKPISANETETNEVRRYVIQVGDRLEEVEPPSFGVSFTIDAPPAAGTKVGAPIQVLGKDPRVSLTYSLSGDGADDFALIPLGDPDRVQIAVADGVTLNPVEQRTYNLTLGVTDGSDHEHNEDDSLDHTLAVNIELTYPWMTLTVDTDAPQVHYGAILTGHVVNFGDPDSVVIQYTFESGHVFGSGRSFTIVRSQPVTERFYAYATYLPPGGNPATDTRRINAQNSVTVTWH